MPTTLPDGLILAGITKREDPRDALVLNNKYKTKGGLEVPLLWEFPKYINANRKTKHNKKRSIFFSLMDCKNRNQY